MTWKMMQLAVLLCVVGGGVAPAADVVLVDKGVSKAPIILTPDASQENARAARALASYIQKISDAKMPVLAGVPPVAPETAIWVGIQPAVEKLFPGVNLQFQKPEEILIVANGRNVLIAGSDRFVGDKQVEFGTANAVYTFIEKQLDVRWLWPGELGEDIIRTETIAIAPMEYRFAPPFQQRGIFHRAGGPLLDWTRAQRIQLQSLSLDAGHGFDKWWDQYHESNPDYFALQPDGTRSGYPSPGNAKLCETNPRVWAQWLDNVAAEIQKDPSRTAFNAAPNDGSNQGLCVCDDCRKWDNLDARRWQMNWRGLSQEYVAMSDRYVTFWNRLSQGLKERFPDRRLFVLGYAYGPAKPAPIKARADENVIISFVGHSPTASDAVREAEKQDWRDWAATAGRMTYRPNVFWYSGGWNGIPTVSLHNTIEDFRFLAENNCIGLTLDTVPQHWATQGVQHYLLAQLAWDPLQDGKAVLADYYRRGFADAAEEIEAYWNLMEQAHAQITGPGFRHSMGVIRSVLAQCQQAYSPDVLDKAQALLDRADQKLAGKPEIYRRRVEFLRTGLEFTRLQMEVAGVMTAVRQTSGNDRAAVQKAIELCEKRDELMKRHGGIAINAHHFNITWNRARKMQDYLGPPSEAMIAGKAAGDGQSVATKVPRTTVVNTAPAEQQGWTLAFSDDFGRTELGPDWQIVEGTWIIKDGKLASSGGVLISTKAFPGNQRLEYEIVSNVKPFPFFGPDTQASLAVSDMSTILHARDGSYETGYFLQFGGFLNRRNILRRLGTEVDQTSEQLIVPDKLHKIIAESDGRHVRLIVDGNLVLEYADAAPLVGEEQGRIGFYHYTAANIQNLRLYTKSP